jgi:enoyl-CoA hydratase/carnithine racemase
MPASATSPLVLTESDAGITLVTLNRPEALNALSRALRGAIVQTFERLRNDAATEVIILTGAGRAFTAGLDLKELGGERDPDTTGITDRDLARAIAEVDRPIIGAINGYAITGGFEIALMCDFLIASTAARFADTHARVGVVPGWGLSQRLPRLIGINRAKELSLTGNYLTAERAYEWGLVNRVVEPDELLPTCTALARDILTTDPATRREIRRIMDQGWHSTLGEGMTIELDASRAHSRRELTPEKVAARRKGIQARGREQNR